MLEEKPKSKATSTYANRILKALARVYENPDAGIQEVIQAAKLASEILERRPPIRHKTDKEKMVEKALGISKSRPFGPKKKATPSEENVA
jgi:hypothetical protein